MQIDLEPFGRQDFQRLIRWVPDEAFLLRWAGTSFHYPLDEAQLEEYLRPTEGELATRKAYKAVDAVTRQAVGHIELNNIDRSNRSARVARVMVGEPMLRRRGIGTEMLQAIFEIGFQGMGLHRIELVVFESNQPAIAFYEKAGFVREGRLRDARRHGGRYWSLLLLSVLEDEWRLRTHPGAADVGKDAGQSSYT